MKMLETKKANLGTRGALKAIKIYQSWSTTRLPRCRYIPTCSEYGSNVIETHGVLKGFFYTVKRLCRCHPFGGFGYDPPPARDGLDVNKPIEKCRVKEINKLQNYKS